MLTSATGMTPKEYQRRRRWCDRYPSTVGELNGAGAQDR
jgi:hypothetical protein